MNQLDMYGQKGQVIQITKAIPEYDIKEGVVFFPFKVGGDTLETLHYWSKDVFNTFDLRQMSIFIRAGWAIYIDVPIEENKQT